MIKRHNIPAFSDARLSGYRESIEWLIKSIPTFKLDYYKLSAVNVLNNTRECMALSCTMGLPKEETFLNLYYMSQFGVNHFKLATSDKIETSVNVGESKVKVIGRFTRDYIDHGTWKLVFIATFILRNKAALAALCSIDNVFMEKGFVSFNDVKIAEVNVYKAMIYDDKTLIEQLISTKKKKAFFPERIQPEDG